MSTHVLSLLVEDKPGLLTRVAGLFARRGFNIESLAVGVTEVPGLSRITVVVDVEELPLEQVTKQLNKLVNVIKIVELDPVASVQREHMLVKVRADNQTRSNVLEVVNLFRGSIGQIQIRLSRRQLEIHSQPVSTGIVCGPGGLVSPSGPGSQLL